MGLVVSDRSHPRSYLSRDPASAGRFLCGRLSWRPRHARPQGVANRTICDGHHIRMAAAYRISHHEGELDGSPIPPDPPGDIVKVLEDWEPR
jgi:hypothetical protein